MLVGVALGANAAPLQIPSRLVLRVLGALAPPLILLAIVQAFLHAQIAGRQTLRLAGLLLLNTLVAIGIGLAVANLIQPGRWVSAARNAGQPTSRKPASLATFLESVPKSLLGPLSDDGKVMSVIFLAVAMGISLRRVKDHKIHTVEDVVHVALDSLIVVLHWIIDVIPLAVFGIVAAIVGEKGFGDFIALGGFVVAVLVGLTLQAIYYLTRVRLGSWVRPLDLLRGTRDALVMAFSTGSSTATMPVTYACLREKVGLRAESASLGALVGSNFNNDGTALYEAMAALFVSQLLVSQSLAEPLTLGQQFLVVLTSVVASVGAAGIPEAGLVTMTMVFQGRRAADRVYRHAADGRLVSGPLPHGDQRDGRPERELPARRQGAREKGAAEPAAAVARPWLKPRVSLLGLECSSGGDVRRRILRGLAAVVPWPMPAIFVAHRRQEGTADQADEGAKDAAADNHRDDRDHAATSGDRIEIAIADGGERDKRPPHGIRQPAEFVGLSLVLELVHGHRTEHDHDDHDEADHGQFIFDFAKAVQHVLQGPVVAIELEQPQNPQHANQFQRAEIDRQLDEKREDRQQVDHRQQRERIAESIL